MGELKLYYTQFFLALRSRKMKAQEIKLIMGTP